MKTHPNQKVIIINKDLKKEEERVASFNWDSMEKALADLGKSTFILWLYIGGNINNYKFAIGHTGFNDWSGITKSTYLASMQELIEKGYLVQSKENSNLYVFYECPNNNTPISNKDIEYQIITKTKEKQEKTGYIYIIKMNEYYKIGKTKNFTMRMGEYTKLMENPEMIDCIYCGNEYSEIEKELHEMFKDKNTNGEWFKLKEEDIKEIRKYLYKRLRLLSK